MKRYLIFNLLIATLSVFVISLTGCENELDTVETADQVVVTLSVDQLFQEKAFIRVRHDGGNGQFWFHFLTEDLESDASGLIKEELKETYDFYGEILGEVGVNKSVTFENLKARTDYRVIAAAVTETGKICSNIAELTFCTMRDPAVFEINENWDISYTRRAASEEDPNVETEYFTVTSSDSLTYYPFVVLKSDFKNYYNNDIRTCFESYVEFRNSENVKWSRIIMQSDSTHTQDRLRSNDYIAFMMGIDEEGVLTGYYACKEIKIAQETPSEAYVGWLGTWTVTGSAHDNTPRSYEITIKADENNLYYKMYGWEGDNASSYYTDVPQTLPITLYFEKSTGNAYVVSGFLGEPVEDILFYIYGNGYINGEATPINIENLKVARFTNVNGKPILAAEKYAVYDNAGNYLTDNYFSFGYCYTMRGYEYLLAPFTPDNKVPDLNGIKIEKK